MRRAPQLHPENGPPRIWRLRLADGSIREPLNVEHVRALVETGAVSGETEIASVGDDTWARLCDHSIWPDVEPPPPAVRLSTTAPVDVGVIPVEVHAVTPKMEAMWSEHHDNVKADLTARSLREDQGRLLQSFACASAVAGLICVGDIIVFTCSLVTAFILLVAFVRFVALALVWRSMR